MIHNAQTARRLATLAFCLIATAHGASAQPAKSDKIIGSRLRAPQPFNYVRVPPALKAAATTTMQALYDIVRRDTMFYEPVSFDVQGSARIDVPPQTGFAAVEYDLPSFMFAYGPDTPATAPGWRSPTRAFRVQGNGLDLFFRSTGKWEEDAHGPMYFEPPRLPDLQGFPAYGKGLVVVTRSERPIYIPAPLERTMKLWIEQNKKGIEEMKAPSQQKYVATMNACIGKLEGQLAAMSPAERAGPTYFSLTRAPGREPSCHPFSSASDKTALRIIMENPAFYDTTRSPTAIQVVFVNLYGFNQTAADRAQVDRIAKRLDWSALAALTAK